MHANRFEKDVQDKLGGMQLQPSTPVWEEVERRIRQERRKRRMLLFWLFPLLLAAGWGTYRLLSAGSSPVQQGSRQTGTETPTAQSSATDRISTEAEAVARTPRKQELRNTTVEPASSEADATIPVSKAAADLSPATASTKHRVAATFSFTNNGPLVAARRPARPSRNKTKSRRNGNGTPINTVTAPAKPSTIESQSPAVTVVPSLPVVPQTTELPNKDSIREASIASSKKNDSLLQTPTPPTPTPPARKRRLQWAIEAGGGVAAPVGADELPLRAAGNNSVSTSSTSTGAQSWKNGATLHLGANLSLPVKGRLRLQTGIHFEWIRLKQESTIYSYAGASSGNPFGSPPGGNSSIKTTTAHNLAYLQLPLLLEWRPVARSSFSISGGIAINQLLSKPPVEGMRNNPVGLQLGARFRIAKVGTHSLELGPQLSAGLNRFTPQQRLLRAGAVLRFSF